MPSSTRPAASDLTRKRRSHAVVRRYPVATFLVALAFSFVVSPFEEQMKDGAILEVGRMTLVLLAGLLALSDRRRPLFWGIGFVSVALAVKWMNHLWLDVVPAWIFPVLALLFAGFVVLHLFQFIFRSPKVNSEVVCAGIAGYLMLALMWAMAYDFVGQLDPHAFVFSVGPSASQVMKGFTALYFSCVTICTVGYGDIVPVTGASRMLAMAEGMTGTLFMAVLIARLVALYSTESNDQKN